MSGHDQIKKKASPGEGDHAFSHVAIGWSACFGLVAAALFLEGYILESRSQPATLRGATLRFFFWVLTAFIFACIIAVLFEPQHAGSFLASYSLDYTLGNDNLFVFYLVFKSYSTPDSQIMYGLTLGMAGAVVLRFVIIHLVIIGFGMHIAFKLSFGAFLVIRGFQTCYLADGDDDVDPRLAKCLSAVLPVHPGYDDRPSFFVVVADGDECKGEAQSEGGKQTGEAAEDLENVPDGQRKPRRKATLLLVASLTIAFLDFCCSFDSMGAKVLMVYQFPSDVNLFLNYTATIMCLMSIRGLYFTVNIMANRFQLFKYGVGLIQVFLGMKLLLEKYIEVEDNTSNGIVIFILLSSAGTSVFMPATEQPVESPTTDSMELPAQTFGKSGATDVVSARKDLDMGNDAEEI